MGPGKKIIILSAMRNVKKDARNSKQASSIKLSSGEGKAWEENNGVNVLLVIGTCSFSLGTSLRLKREARGCDGLWDHHPDSDPVPVCSFRVFQV